MRKNSVFNQENSYLNSWYNITKGFGEFLERNAANYEKAEYLLPTIVGDLLEEGKTEVKVLESHDQWFGVTYKEDKEYVAQSIRKLIAQKVYPEKLF